MRCAVAVALVALAACARNPPPGELYRNTAAQLRRGDLNQSWRLLSTAKASPDPEWTAKFRLLEAEILVARGDSEQALARLNEPVPEALEARRWRIRADALLRLDQYTEAKAALDEAAKRAGVDPELALDVELLRGLLLTTANQVGEGGKVLNSALDRARQRGDAYQIALAYLYLGLNRIRVFRYDAAMIVTLQALKNAETAGAEWLRASALGNLGLCYARLGDFEKGRQYTEQVIAIREKLGDLRRLQSALGIAGNVHLLEGDAKKAIPYYRRAVEIARQVKAESYLSVWTANLAEAAAEAGDWDAAEQLSREAQARNFQDPQTRVSAKLVEAAIAAGRKRYAAAESLYQEIIRSAPSNPGQLWEAEASLAGLYVESGAPSKASPHFDKAIRIVERTRAELLQSEHRVTFLSRLIRFYQAYVAMLVADRQIARALEIAESSRARILAERTGGKAAPPRRPPPAGFERAAQRANAVLLSYWLAPRRSFLWVVTAGGTELFELPADAEIAALAAAHLDEIQRLRDPVRFEQSPGRRLYDLLIRPAEKLIPQGAHVLLVPDGPLHRINFETLAVGGPRPHYWIEDVSLTVAPSLSVAQNPLGSAKLDSLLLIGDAESAAADYPKLPHAAREIELVARSLEAASRRAVVTGARATPAAYREAPPGRYSLIHFAAHGVANRANPLDSAIVLSPRQGAFLLYAREIAELPLEADLVTVASCRGAGARFYPGEGLVGLAWAFLHAGAKSVIAGLWDVSDQSTVETMASFYAHLAAAKPPDQALREAKLGLLRGGVPHRLPYYWGPFQLYRGK